MSFKMLLVKGIPLVKRRPRRKEKLVGSCSGSTVDGYHCHTEVFLISVIRYYDDLTASIHISARWLLLQLERKKKMKTWMRV